MQKRSAIRAETMLKIAKKHERYPDISLKSLADTFNVSLRQVTYAIKKHKNNEFEFKSTLSKYKKKKLMLEVNEEIASEQRTKTSKEILKEEFEKLTLLVSVDEKMSYSNRVDMLKDLMAISKQILAVDLSTQIKDPDVERIAIMIRLIQPEATDEYIIELWKRACELYKVS